MSEGTQGNCYLVSCRSLNASYFHFGSPLFLPPRRTILPRSGWPEFDDFGTNHKTTLWSDIKSAQWDRSHLTFRHAVFTCPAWKIAVVGSGQKQQRQKNLWLISAIFFSGSDVTIEFIWTVFLILFLSWEAKLNANAVSVCASKKRLLKPEFPA